MDKIELPAGVLNTASKAKKTANWREVNLIRWTGDTTRPINGWEDTGLGPFASRLRATFKWSDNVFTEYIAFLCEEHLYVLVGAELRDITPGGGIVGPSTLAAGYGEYLYNYDTYGTPRPGQTLVDNPAPAYTLDNWGDKLLAMTSNDGRLLEWDPAGIPTDNAVAVLNAPINNRSFVVTPERYVILFAMGGEKDKYGWCDQEDNTNWTFGDPLSDAGYYNIEPKSPIMTATKSLGGTLMSSKNQIFFIEYIGQPKIYRHQPLGAFTMPLSFASVCEISEGIMWQANNGFWIFNGVSISPVECDIKDWIIDRIDYRISRIHAYAIPVRAKSEVWFFFVSNDSPDGYNDFAAIYDYKNRIWSMAHNLSRSCGFGYPNDLHPLMSDGVKVYQHEMDKEYADYTEKPWLETHVINFDDGTDFLTILNLFPEIQGDPAGIQFRMARSTVRQPDRETYTAQRSIRSNGYVDIRETARDFRLRIDAQYGNGWSLGNIGINAVRRGKKT